MESQKSPPVLNSLTERKSRFLLLTKLERKAAGETKRAIVGRLAGLPPELRRTLTLDNGTENTLHEEITMEIGTNEIGTKIEEIIEQIISYQLDTSVRPQPIPNS